MGLDPGAARRLRPSLPHGSREPGPPGRTPLTVIEPTPSGPHAEYTRRLATRRADAEELERRDRSIANIRLVVALIGAGVLAAILMRALPPLSLLLPVLLFAALVLVHDRVSRKLEDARRAVGFYEKGLARLEERWAGTGSTGETYRDPLHPYADDLDLFGKGSLFELLCTARTSTGERTLAGWLMATSPAEEVRSRQEAVRDLLPRLDLREAISRRGEAVRSGVDVEALIQWGAAPVTLTGSGVRIVGGVLAALTLGAAGLWAAGFGWMPLLAMVVVEQAFLAPFSGRITAVVRGVDRPARDLALLADLLALLEQEQFASPRLQQFRAGLETGSELPSQRLARLDRLVAMLHSQRNGIFGVVAFLLLWSMQYSFAIERWRAENGPLLERWLANIGEVEALLALSGYAYEHPGDPFPELLDDGTVFDGEGLGHPLLPVAAVVRNSLRLGPDLRLLLVSGSNMSGKSTLMRTVGTNTVLALAGAPVRATSLRLSPLAIGASLRTMDSLQEGTSRFYAEIKRLRQVVDLTGGEYPVLFLLDEILHGTNSHDRRIGAEAVIRALLARGAIGMVTTHDLALARIADEPDLHALNVHLEDHLEDGQMRFDYQLRPGVVQKSNALELMRSIGLDV